MGLVQGFTEFLPVSSSGHLIFLPRFFGWPDQGVAFDVVMHLGTLVAVIIFFRARIRSLSRALFSRDPGVAVERKTAWLIGLSLVPAAAVGYLLETNFRSPLLTAVNLIGWGLVLGAADLYTRRRNRVRSEAQPGTDVSSLNGRLTWKKALFIGSAQAVALLPGTSRSGITMTAGLFSGFGRTAAAEFSFLMSVPIIALAGLSKAAELFRGGLDNIAGAQLVWGFAASAVSGLIAIGLLMRVIKRWSFLPFVAYRLVIGILIILLV